MRSAWGCHSHRHLRTGKPPGAWTGEVRNKTFPAASQGAFLELCTLLPHSSSAPQWPRLVCNLVLPWTEWEHELGDHLAAFLLPWEACVHRPILFLRPVIWILDRSWQSPVCILRKPHRIFPLLCSRFSSAEEIGVSFVWSPLQTRPWCWGGEWTDSSAAL